MDDMLVKLYNLPDIPASGEFDGYCIKRAIAPERSVIADWVRDNFSQAWFDECSIAFSNHPVSCFVAYRDQKILGFACYNCTSLGFLGPMGVDSKLRDKGIGKQLLLAALQAMKGIGYQYAIIGGVGPARFYEKAVNAQKIDGSNPGLYKDLLKASN